MRFATVLFDLDGTLIDHLRAIHRSYSHTLPQLGLPAPTLEQVRRAIGGGLEHAMRKFVPEAQLAAALAIYRAYWDRTMLDDVELLPGAREVLTGLQARGVTCAVFTNKHGPSSRRVCEHLGIAPFLQRVYGAHDTPWLKPQPEYAALVLRELGAEAGTTLMVGDSPFDVQAARNGGLAACWCVITGTHEEHELQAAGADRVFPGLHEVGRELFS
ncbi:MAG: HAD family hydrolase [Opitutae bacterium]|nr:HAD family hydrolase [Opitutae bacterium]